MRRSRAARPARRPGSSRGSRAPCGRSIAVPFSVCTGSRSLAVAVADAEAARLEVGRVRRRGQLAIALLAREPALDVVLLRRRGAEVAGRDVDDAVRKAERLRGSPPRSRAVARARRSTAAAVAEDEQLDLVELVDAEHAARVLAGGARLAPEVRREGRRSGAAAPRGSRPCAGRRAATSEVPVRYSSSASSA